MDYVPPAHVVAFIAAGGGFESEPFMSAPAYQQYFPSGSLSPFSPSEKNFSDVASAPHDADVADQQRQ
jgi:hypothetical protein